MDLDNTVDALDSTAMDLCLSLCPWAPFQRSRGAIQLHTLLDLRGSIPTFLRIPRGRISDVSTLDEMPFEAGAFYVPDRNYLHFARRSVRNAPGCSVQ